MHLISELLCLYCCVVYIVVAVSIAVIGLLLLMVVGVACATYMYRAHEDTVSSVGMKKHISK